MPLRLASLLLVTSLLLVGCSEEGVPRPSGDGADPGPAAAAEDGSSTQGSSAPAMPPEGNRTAPSPTGLRLALDDCRNFGAVFPVPMEAAQASLPAGFAPVPTPSDPAGGATLYVLALRCAGSSVDGVETGAVDLAYAELAVVPSADLPLADIGDATVPLVFTASTPAVGAALAALRLGLAGAGDVGWAETAGAGDLVVAAEFGGASLALRGAYLPTPPASLGAGGDFVLYGVQDSAVRTVVRGTAAGGEAVDATVTLESSGLDLVAQARPAARGFSVAGFSLAFERVA